VSSAAVSSIAVNCVGPFSVGGHVSGLSPNASLTIIDNGTDVLTVSANGSFTFSTSLKPGASYAAAISALPSGEKCGLTGSSGTVATSSYTGISITCAIRPLVSSPAPSEALAATTAIVLPPVFITQPT